MLDRFSQIWIGIIEVKACLHVGGIDWNTMFYLLDQLNTGLEVHTEVDELPVDTLALVFFLFQDKHVMVEKLLQFFIRKVDAKLLKSIILYQKIIYHRYWICGRDSSSDEYSAFCRNDCFGLFGVERAQMRVSEFEFYI